MQFLMRDSEGVMKLASRSVCEKHAMRVLGGGNYSEAEWLPHPDTGKDERSLHYEIGHALPLGDHWAHGRLYELLNPHGRRLMLDKASERELLAALVRAQAKAKEFVGSTRYLVCFEDGASELEPLS
jgi:hypothetical protein